ncbi:hypothetical protein BDR26DRAFT_863972 [Obelidium mucronatum]|nr:hypothetical protein BDR26DRAFT_863972 [Obelidium mucronatum]
MMQELIQSLIFRFYAIFAPLVILEGVGYFLYISYFELYLQGKTISIESLFTALNTALAFEAISLSFAYIARGLNIAQSLAIPWNALFLMEQLSLASAQYCYAIYSYKRSSSLLRSVYSARFQKRLHVLVSVLPLFFIIPIIPSIWLLISPDQATETADLIPSAMQICGQFLSALCILTLDIVFLNAFMLTLAKTHDDDSDAVSPEFRIIASHGIAGCVVCFVSLGLYAATVGISSLVVKTLLIAASHGLLNVVLCILFLMKVRIMRVKDITRTERTTTQPIPNSFPSANTQAIQQPNATEMLKINTSTASVSKTSMAMDNSYLTRNGTSFSLK